MDKQEWLRVPPQARASLLADLEADLRNFQQQLVQAEEEPRFRRHQGVVRYLVRKIEELTKLTETVKEPEHARSSRTGY